MVIWFLLRRRRTGAGGGRPGTSGPVMRVNGMRRARGISLSRRFVLSDGFGGYDWGRVSSQATPTVPGSTTTPDIQRWWRWWRRSELIQHVAAIGVIAAGLRLRLSAHQYPRDRMRPHDAMASEMEAARKASDCQPHAAFTKPLPNELAAVIAFWMWLMAIVASLRYVARLKVKESVKISGLTGAWEVPAVCANQNYPFKHRTHLGVSQAKHPETVPAGLAGPADAARTSCSAGRFAANSEKSWKSGKWGGNSEKSGGLGRSKPKRRRKIGRLREARGRVLGVNGTRGRLAGPIRVVHSVA